MGEQLDDRSFVTRLDPKGMLLLTEEFPNQCRKAFEIAKDVELPSFANPPNVVLLTGLGGSAAGGDVVRALFEQLSAVPFVVNRDYHLPHFVGLNDLVFCASYSGNTEETLSAFEDARRAAAKVVCVTSGGRLAELAGEFEFGLIQIPGGQPPRTALGFMLIPVILTCERLKLIPEQNYEAAFALLDQCARDWSVDVPEAKNEAKQLARALHGKLGALYGLGSWQGLVANRWKGQINENAKNLVLASTFPELNHNEILGWVGAGSQGVAEWVGIMLEDGTESEKMKTRARVTEQLIGATARFYRARARGEDLLQRILSLTFLGDFVSLYLAALNGVDPENIDSINTLKSELSRVG